MHVVLAVLHEWSHGVVEVATIALFAVAGSVVGLRDTMPPDVRDIGCVLGSHLRFQLEPRHQLVLRPDVRSRSSHFQHAPKPADAIQAQRLRAFASRAHGDDSAPWSHCRALRSPADPHFAQVCVDKLAQHRSARAVLGQVADEQRALRSNRSSGGGSSSSCATTAARRACLARRLGRAHVLVQAVCSVLACALGPERTDLPRAHVLVQAACSVLACALGPERTDLPTLATMPAPFAWLGSCLIVGAMPFGGRLPIVRWLTREAHHTAVASAILPRPTQLCAC